MFSGKSLGAKSTHEKSLFTHFKANVEIKEPQPNRQSTRVKARRNYEEETEEAMVNDLEAIHDQNTHHDVVELLTKRRDQGLIDLTDAQAFRSYNVFSNDENTESSVLAKPKLSVLDMMHRNKKTSVSSSPKAAKLEIIEDRSLDNELLELIGEDICEVVLKDQLSDMEIIDDPEIRQSAEAVDKEMQVLRDDIQDSKEQEPPMDNDIEQSVEAQEMSEVVYAQNFGLNEAVTQTENELSDVIEIVSSQSVAQTSNGDLQVVQAELSNASLLQDFPEVDMDAIDSPMAVNIYSMVKGKLQLSSPLINYYYDKSVMSKIQEYHEYTELNRISSIPAEFEYLIILLSLEQQATLKTLLPVLKTILNNPDLDDAGIRSVIKRSLVRVQYGATSPKVPPSLSVLIWELADPALLNSMPICDDLKAQIVSRQETRQANKQLLDKFVSSLGKDDRELFLSGKSKWNIIIDNNCQKSAIEAMSRKRRASNTTVKIKKVKKPSITQPVIQSNNLDCFITKSVATSEVAPISEENPQLFTKSMQYQSSLNCPSVLQIAFIDQSIMGLHGKDVLEMDPDIPTCISDVISQLTQLAVHPNADLNNPYVIQQFDDVTGQVSKLYRKTIIIKDSQQSDIIDTIWDRCSLLITGSTPFKMDEKYFNYDVDSDVEMEMEDLDEDELEDEPSVDEEMDEENSEIVPHGYLSADELGSQVNEVEEFIEDKKAILKPYTSDIKYCNTVDEQDITRHKSGVIQYYEFIGVNAYTYKPMAQVGVKTEVKDYFNSFIIKDIAGIIHESSKTLNDLKIDIHAKYPDIPKTRIEHKIKELSNKQMSKWMLKDEYLRMLKEE